MEQYLNTKTLHFSYKVALFYERLRKIFILHGLYKSALLTYFLQNYFFYDRNNHVFWDDLFSKKTETSPIKKWRYSIVLKEISSIKNILNVGVGNGDFEKWLFELFPNIDYFGTDITDKTLKIVQKKFPDKFFFRENIESFSFGMEKFDQVCLLEVIEHIKPNKTHIVLRELNRIMRQGGKLIISFPVNEGLDKLLPYNPSSHMRAYSLNLLKFEILTSGFKLINIYKASAFRNSFFIKNFFNNIFGWKKPNNYVVVCIKK